MGSFEKTCFIFTLVIKMALCFIVPEKAPGKTVHLVRGGTNNRTKVQLWDRLTKGHKSFQNQVWIFDGTIFRSRKNPSKCLHLVRGKTSNGTRIQLWDVLQKNDKNVLNQMWKLEGKSIVSRKDNGACWHLVRGGTGNRTKIQLWHNKDHPNGAWRIQYLKKKGGPQPRL